MENVFVKLNMPKLKVFADLAHPIHGHHLTVLSVFAKKIITGTQKQDNVMKWDVLHILALFTPIIFTNANVTRDMNGWRANVSLPVTRMKFGRMESVSVEKIMCFWITNVLPALQTHGFLQTERLVSARKIIIGIHTTTLATIWSVVITPRSNTLIISMSANASKDTNFNMESVNRSKQVFVLPDLAGTRKNYNVSVLMKTNISLIMNVNLAAKTKDGMEKSVSVEPDFIKSRVSAELVTPIPTIMEFSAFATMVTLVMEKRNVKGAMKHVANALDLGPKTVSPALMSVMT